MVWLRFTVDEKIIVRDIPIEKYDWINKSEKSNDFLISSFWIKVMSYCSRVWMHCRQYNNTFGETVLHRESVFIVYTSGCLGFKVLIKNNIYCKGENIPLI
jgi:hypothetical protein